MVKVVLLNFHCKEYVQQEKEQNDNIIKYTFQREGWIICYRAGAEGGFCSL